MEDKAPVDDTLSFGPGNRRWDCHINKQSAKLAVFRLRPPGLVKVKWIW